MDKKNEQYADIDENAEMDEYYENLEDDGIEYEEFNADFIE